jgi:hypothetical protein
VQPTDNHSGIRSQFRQARAAVARSTAPAPSKKPRKRGDEDKGRIPWRRPLERGFVRAILAGKLAKARAAFKDAKPIIDTRGPAPPDRHTALAVDMADALDWMNPFEPPEAFAADVDANYSPPQDWHFPQP